MRYPNFSNNELVAYFLTIFNRLAGSADEMGTFVQELTRALGESELQVAKANKKEEETLAAMDRMIGEIKQLNQQDEETSGKLTELQQEVDKLRKITPLVRLPDLIDTNFRANALTALADTFGRINPNALSLADLSLESLSELGKPQNVEDNK